MVLVVACGAVKAVVVVAPAATAVAAAARLMHRARRCLCCWFRADDARVDPILSSLVYYYFAVVFITNCKYCTVVASMDLSTLTHLREPSDALSVANTIVIRATTSTDKTTVSYCEK